MLPSAISASAHHLPKGETIPVLHSSTVQTGYSLTEYQYNIRLFHLANILPEYAHASANLPSSLIEQLRRQIVSRKAFSNSNKAIEMNVCIESPT
jgi:hypothetical protein